MAFDISKVVGTFYEAQRLRKGPYDTWGLTDFAYLVAGLGKVSGFSAESDGKGNDTYFIKIGPPQPGSSAEMPDEDKRLLADDGFEVTRVRLVRDMTAVDLAALELEAARNGRTTFPVPCDKDTGYCEIRERHVS